MLSRLFSKNVLVSVSDLAFVRSRQRIVRAGWRKIEMQTRLKKRDADVLISLTADGVLRNAHDNEID